MIAIPQSTKPAELRASMISQTLHVKDLPAEERDRLIISMRKVDDHWVVTSRYGDPTWNLASPTTNMRHAAYRLNFDDIAAPFRDSIKAVMYRYMRRGREGCKRPGAAQQAKVFLYIRYFIDHLVALRLTKLAEVTEIATSTYVQACKEPRDWYQCGLIRKTVPGSKRFLSRGTQSTHFSAVEALFELSQFTSDPMKYHPWPSSSAESHSGASKEKRQSGSKTPLIPDDIFVNLFQRAWYIVESAEGILDLRDAADRVALESVDVVYQTVRVRKLRKLQESNPQQK